MSELKAFNGDIYQFSWFIILVFLLNLLLSLSHKTRITEIFLGHSNHMMERAFI